MLKSIVAAVALLAAMPAAAQAPALQSTTDAFDGFATSTATMPPAERVKAFRAKFDALVPGFYEPRFGATEAQYDARVQKALEGYPAERDKFLDAAKRFQASYATASARFRTFFPDYAPDMPVYLLHSLGEMDGGTRDLRGRIAAVFGADMIARIHDPASIGPFLDHEMFHFHHAKFFPDCPALWCSLWQEGLAVYVAARMNPGTDDRALLLTFPRPIRPEVEPRLAEAMCFVRGKLASTDEDDYATFFFGRGSEAQGGWPPRFGYYLGYVLAKQLGDSLSLDALAKLPPEQVKAKLEAALAGYRC
ncbi:hypothetical protein P6144_03180 [Sphingomonas sp. HITSZ_GF]|uniref:hypothetical protein n=1 Tax=Sphingomonas sp. HITSZ_GF TaxID=3037247 RepID=UPI00240DA993|nr:hypothetical protein [Sphingomonas sp. HITSZ_GF]MDG2532637.1 hypothetical protein [Sphingomonas sp. HITSZ_GF]